MGLNTWVEHGFKGLVAKIAIEGFLHPQCYCSKKGRGWRSEMDSETNDLQFSTINCANSKKKKKKGFHLSHNFILAPRFKDYNFNL